jgi:hypothetical protein
MRAKEPNYTTTITKTMAIRIAYSNVSALVVSPEVLDEEALHILLRGS